jgi:hypothetical protein
MCRRLANLRKVCIVDNQAFGDPHDRCLSRVLSLSAMQTGGDDSELFEPSVALTFLAESEQRYSLDEQTPVQNVRAGELLPCVRNSQHGERVRRYGHAGPRFVRALIETEGRLNLPALLKELHAKFSGDNDSQRRAARTFAVLALAGELVHPVWCAPMGKGGGHRGVRDGLRSLEGAGRFDRGRVAREQDPRSGGHFHRSLSATVASRTFTLWASYITWLGTAQASGRTLSPDRKGSSKSASECISLLLPD